MTQSEYLANNRKSGGLQFSGILLLLLCFSVGLAWADEPKAAEETNNGQDPTRPLTRFDLRYQYQETPAAVDHNEHIITPRVDKPFVLGHGWTFATRLDVPLMASDVVSGDNMGGKYQFGLADVLVQALLIKTVSKTFAWAAGAQLIFPTATRDELGAGKYRVVPTFGARWITPCFGKGSWFAMIGRVDADYAGEKDRKHIRNLQLQPMFNFSLPKAWFLSIYPSSDIRVNLADKRGGDTGRLFLPIDFMVGKMVRRRVVASVEVGVPIIDDYKVYDFKMEARLGVFF